MEPASPNNQNFWEPSSFDTNNQINTRRPSRLEERPLTSTGRRRWASIDWETEQEAPENQSPNLDEPEGDNPFATFNIPFDISRNALLSLIEQIRSGQEEEMRGLPREMIDKVRRMKMGKSGQDCSVCYNGFHKGEKIRKLPCKHIFHDQCILPWLEQNITCPNCRFNLVDFFTENPDGEY